MRYLLCLFVAGLTLSSVAQDAPPPHGTVIFSRDQNTAPTEKKEETPAKQPEVTVTDAERNSLTFTAYDLDVHLAPEKAQLAVHARVTVQNSGTQPLTRLVLQVPPLCTGRVSRCRVRKGLRRFLLLNTTSTPIWTIRARQRRPWFR